MCSVALTVSPRRIISTSHFSPVRRSRGEAIPGVGGASSGVGVVGEAPEEGDELLLRDTPIRQVGHYTSSGETCKLF